MPCPAPTARLSFRELTLDDVDNLQTIFADPVAMEHYPSTKDIAETRKWIEWNLANYRRCGHGLWAVSLTGSGEFVGQCGLIPQNIRGQEEIEVGYLFGRSHWGQGYASETAAACRDHAFQTLQTDKLVAFIGPKNQRSKRVASRIGMTLECVLGPSESRWNKEVHVYSALRRVESGQYR